MSENKLCPCCGRHCDLSAPHCDRGKEYLRTGIIPSRTHEQKKPSKTDHIAHYDAMDMDNKLIINLRDLEHVMRFLFEEKSSQKRILIILNETEAMTQRELTERLRIQPGSVSEVIGKLEDAGLIQRTPSLADRRTIDIRLTETGRTRAQEATEQRMKRHKEMFSALSKEEKETLLSLLEKVNLDWDQRYRNNESTDECLNRHGDNKHHGYDEHQRGFRH